MRHFGKSHPSKRSLACLMAFYGQSPFKNHDSTGMPWALQAKSECSSCTLDTTPQSVRETPDGQPITQGDT